MTDSPIYERLASGDPLNPLANNRRALIIDDTVVTTPVSAEVARAIRDVERRYFRAAADALAPFGLHPYDIAAPEYARIVYRDELETVGSPVALTS